MGHVLLSHNPPYGHCDVGGRGSRALADRVGVVRPVLHVFGHLHGGSGHDSSASTVYVNAANDLSPVHYCFL
eukprot:NODE_4824_length_419_cov_394.348649_g3827_i0.p1 GENE.NODE_4824_length_419_cov_394.348649_g3827_i0~~NODE_4824_length_419_cov_394.348649_g3827_i0.p1  ORF type:complete len:72 (+),score=18.27 NODE_4824_length_419_cov_394.348649_g3827_i0:34-249(+)